MSRTVRACRTCGLATNRAGIAISSSASVNRPKEKKKKEIGVAELPTAALGPTTLKAKGKGREKGSLLFDDSCVPRAERFVLNASGILSSTWSGARVAHRENH
jgi:hypothetical protein